MIRIFLLDDHEVVRRGVRELLDAEDDMTVVGEAATGKEALARIPATKPDVALLDLRLPDGDGVSVCREIRSRRPEVHCVMLTSFADDEALFSAIMAGAAGYILKQVKGPDLVASVRRVGRGESLVPGREDGEELRVEPAGQAGYEPAHGSRRVRGPPVRTAAKRGPLSPRHPNQSTRT